ncbi:Glycolate dehydrogenase, FAD-binding subunit GlcE [hydrothermal vent metagenome]|uniref:Glycolate dehydrogenase, FAD-binding subunit GlcE n=1 Tax=hydrothermal vent metagenome TaxID=652676 RepID=A0A3B0YBG1_9ZZZZ
MEQDLTLAFCEQIRQACDNAKPLFIQGGNSKSFYGRPCQADILQTGKHQGILSYEPSELVLHARSGTRLADIEQQLDEQRQMLAFEPPHFDTNSTLGGAIATGLSGPRRPFAGSARDFVLGTGIINGKGEALRFGGQVMKNVAGYDLSRLMCGALGTLGLITDISIKVLPKPDVDYTLKQVCSQSEAIERLTQWQQKPLPLSAACWHDEYLYLRLSGSEAATRQAQHQLGDSIAEKQPAFWASIRDHQHPWLQRERPLWRLSVPPAAPPLAALQGDWLLDWGGAQRWLYSDEPAARIRQLTSEAGGHATLFRHYGDGDDVFHPLPAGLLALHQRLKAALDPHYIFNPGRQYKNI